MASFSAQGRGGGGGDVLYTELWKEIAGPLVEVPRAGEQVMYFPQGHMEQLEASINQELNQRIPLFKLQSKILCRVINVHLLAEQETDEVYAKIALLPEAAQTEPTTPDSCPPQPPRPKLHSFSKVLTASDTRTHGAPFVHLHESQLYSTYSIFGPSSGHEPGKSSNLCSLAR
ncbi:hypothetical protein SLEP1_g45146 [Rubroshorea leprosula]|uniref:Uncharacterized protein n=1 Tax=Rubroshorea leprosula TaxID=152421 RepID=A0AAV5LIT5_9ROSI|nr:hypothetical protein SLEP1_g45146 [Rubroshorea leprosula]